MGGVDIAAQTRKREVDQRLPLKYYFRTADNVLRQADVYRREGNQIELYVLLLRFASLIMETIPDHKEYKVGGYRQEREDFMKRLPTALDEVEKLKPVVQRLNNQYSQPVTYSSGVEDGVWPAYEFDGTADYLFSPPSGSSNKTYSAGNGSFDLLTGPMDLLTGTMPPRQLSAPSSSNLVTKLNDMSFNIPRARQETLSRHSFLGQINQQRTRTSQPMQVQYPTSFIDGTPISLPSFDSSQVASKPAEEDKFKEKELILWSDTDPSAASVPAVLPAVADVAPEVKLIRQPSPPPIEAPVQIVPAPAQPHPSDVADPRPGPPAILEDKMAAAKGPKPVHISVRLMEEFMHVVKNNTQRNLETCGVLAGSLKKGKFSISAVILPKQQSTSDSCTTVQEEEIFDAIDKRGLFQLGWIHTHPTQSCFMSSIDLHTHYSYQIMSQEAVAIVMAPTDRNRKYGIFRLSDPGGVKVIQSCQQRGFHPHPSPPDGGPIYEHCSHVFLNPKLKFEFIDLR